MAAVHSVIGHGGHGVLCVTTRFGVFDTVTIKHRNGTTVNGEIVYIGKDEVHVTAPYEPIQVIKFTEISQVQPWPRPEEWK